VFEFAGPRPNPVNVPLQVVAVRFAGGDKLQHIVEHLIYDENNGLVRTMSRDQVIAYLDKYGPGSVISRDSRNTKVAVVAFTHDGARWLKTAADGEIEDNLYSLYRYSAPQPAAQTSHAVSINFAQTRTLETVFDFIIRSDATGDTELLGREVLASKIAASAPGVYIVETPRIRRMPLVFDQIAGKKIVKTGLQSANGPDAIFDLPRHFFNLFQL
jgi:hypothetical protein